MLVTYVRHNCLSEEKKLNDPIEQKTISYIVKTIQMLCTLPMAADNCKTSLQLIHQLIAKSGFTVSRSALVRNKNELFELVLTPTPLAGFMPLFCCCNVLKDDAFR